MQDSLLLDAQQTTTCALIIYVLRKTHGEVAIATILIELSCNNNIRLRIIFTVQLLSFNQLSPFFFSHCDGVHAFICSAWISSNSPFSFKWFCISRCLFRSIMPSKLSETTVSSNFAPHPSLWSIMLHSIAFRYCCLTLLRWRVRKYLQS